MCDLSWGPSFPLRRYHRETRPLLNLAGLLEASHRQQNHTGSGSRVDKTAMGEKPTLRDHHRNPRQPKPLLAGQLHYLLHPSGTSGLQPCLGPPTIPLHGVVAIFNVDAVSLPIESIFDPGPMEYKCSMAHRSLRPRWAHCELAIEPDALVPYIRRSRGCLRTGTQPRSNGLILEIPG